MCRVLLVDDEEAIRRLMSSVLEMANFEVTTAGSAREGIQKLGTEPFDLVLTDLRMETLPSRFEESLQSDLPLAADEIDRLRAFAPRLAELCAELDAYGVAETVQHDDLHFANLYEKDGRLRVLDWGDTSISHPFASLYTPYRFLENVTKLPPGDPWFARLRDAYLEPWGEGHEDAFALALRVAAFAHATAWTRQRDHLPEEEVPEFDRYFPEVLRRALARTVE